jgi:hypothetical protein
MRVFISSTYRDLVPHRERLDVRGMEEFAAQDQPPLATCLAALAECDIYIGVVGERYGSSPPDEARSYTELEYESASERAMYRIVLLSETEPEAAHEPPERHARLLEFRQRLRESHTVDTFTSPDDLAWKVLAAVRNYEAGAREAAAHTGRL